MKLPGQLYGYMHRHWQLTALEMFILAVIYKFYFTISVLKNDKNANVYDIHHRVIFNSKNLDNLEEMVG